MTNFKPVSIEKHKDLKVLPDIDWKFIANQHQLEVTVSELLQSASSFPLFFVKNPENSATSIMAMTSFVMNDNVLVKEDGDHQIAYIPKAARSLPFNLGLDPENDKSVIPFVDEDSNLIDAENGVSLFEEGSATPYFQKMNQQLEQLYHEQIASSKFIQALDALSLIQEVELELTLSNNSKSTLKGLYHLNEDAFNKLDNEQQMSLLSEGYYSGVYAMLSSLTQINRLIQGHAKQGEGVTGVNIKIVE